MSSRRVRLRGVRVRGSSGRVKAAALLVAAALLSQLGSETTFALDPRRGLTQYSHDVWQDKDGLPQNNVQTITQTADGYLWVGTEVGLARFDGVRFTVFNKKKTPEIKNNNITALAAGRDGSLWAGTRGGGLVRLKNGKFTVYTKQEGLASNTVRALAEDRTGNIWVGTNDGLSRLRDEEFKTYTNRDGLPGDNVRAIYEDRGGNLWVGTTDGLARLKDDRFAPVGGLPSDTVRSVAEDREGTLWVGTDRGGLYNLSDEGKAARSYTTKDGLASNFVRAVLADAQGNVWVGTSGGGLVRFRGGEFATYAMRDGLTSDIVRAIYEDREGTLWVGTEAGGLCRFKNGKVTTYTTNEGLSNNFARAILEDAGGALWVGTEGGGLVRLKDNKFTALTTKEGLVSNVVLSLHEDRKGGLWIGTENGGLQRLKDGRLTNYTAKIEPVSNTVWAIHEDQQGSLWVGTSAGLCHLKAGELTRYTTRDGLAANFVKTIYEDRAGNLWIGFRDSGLTRFSDGRFTSYGAGDGLPEANVSSFHEDTEGALWVGTNAGLVRLRAGKFTSYTTSEGLFDDNLHQVLEDGRGRLWMSSSRGIFHVNREELDGLASGKIKAVTPVAYTTADGMKSNECTGDSQPAGWRARDGRLWFPTIKGVVSIDPDDAEFNHLPPPVHIEQVVVDKKPVHGDGRLRLPPGTGEVAFRYTGLSFVAPEEVRFKYKLEGLEPEWTNAETRREAFYTNLPPGDYRFRVMAANNDGVWNEGGAEFAFYLAPYFYQTNWFYALCAFGFFLIVLGAHRLHVRGINREFAAALAERNRIAREWHDTLVAGFAAISWQLEAGVSKLPEAPGVARQHLDVARKMVRHSMTEARRALHDLRSQSLENGDLATALATAVKQLTAGKPLDVRFTVSGTPARLSGDVENNLMRIGQEAVSNVVSHAGASRVSIELCYEPASTRLRIEDDGRGFDAQDRSSANGEHFGLTGMRERAKRIGGEFTLRTAPGGGTEVAVKVPAK